MLALFASLEEIADSEIKLRQIVQVVRIELVRVEGRQKLRIAHQNGVRPQVCGDFLRFILLNRDALGLQRVVVRERHLDRVARARAGRRTVRQKSKLQNTYLVYA